MGDKRKAPPGAFGLVTEDIDEKVNHIASVVNRLRMPVCGKIGLQRSKVLRKILPADWGGCVMLFPPVEDRTVRIMTRQSVAWRCLNVTGCSVLGIAHRIKPIHAYA
jgi:hypothetical protein